VKWVNLYDLVLGLKWNKGEWTTGGLIRCKEEELGDERATLHACGEVGDELTWLC